MGASLSIDVTAGQVLRFAFAPDFASEQSHGVEDAMWELRIYDGLL